MSPSSLRVGTAAWGIPKIFADLFPAQGSHLQRYAQVLNSVEINTSFYRQHRAQSYQKWASVVPPDFRFSVKLFRYFTHEQRLCDYGPKLAQHLEDLKRLGEKLGVVLVQLPPSLNFEPEAEEFLQELRRLYCGRIALEPRHASWNERSAQEFLKFCNITRVVADPDPCPPPLNQMASLRGQKVWSAPAADSAMSLENS